MTKIPFRFSKKTFFISIVAVLIFTAIAFAYFQNRGVQECGGYRNILESCIYIDRQPMAKPSPISYNSNCNIPPMGETKDEIRANMTAIYACAVQNTLSKYKDKSITLESPKTQNDLSTSLFGASKIQTNLLVYDSGNWQIFFWSPKADQKFQTEDYQIHLDSHASNENSLGKSTNDSSLSAAKMTSPTQEMVMSQPGLVIKINNGFEVLNYKHILKITGFETETQMLDFVLVHNKLLGQSQKYYARKTDTPLDLAIRNSIPLLFLQDYQFSNKTDQGLKFNCSKEYTGNLKTQINLDQKEIQYFAHQNQYSLSKITIKLNADTLEYKTENILNCGSMVVC